MSTNPAAFGRMSLSTLKSETLMQQLKPSIDLKKDKEQKPEKGRKRKFSGKQGCFMKMENAGFMMNHY